VRVSLAVRTVVEDGLPYEPAEFVLVVHAISLWETACIHE
jgi:hypothetical protein